jgi:hypothetical protein
VVRVFAGLRSVTRLIFQPRKIMQMSKDIVLEGDTPFLATCDAPIDLIDNGSIDHVNTDMMNVRWRMFPLRRHIPRDEQRNIAACARCFAELILYVEPPV